jgi:mono/diheme cytochrome c family protein
VHKPTVRFSRNVGLITCVISMIGLGILGVPSRGRAQMAAAPRLALLNVLSDRVQMIPAAALPSAQTQDAGQAATPPAAPSAPKPVELPEGDGKPIATEFCQDCHRLTNLTKAHKNLDDWKDTIHTMMDRGARITDDKVDTLAGYLAKNFGPKDSTSAENGQAAAPAAPAPAPGAAASPNAPAASAKATVELPDGDGKAIATENCQACHKLTNLTKAHKSLDDWKDTVQTMIERGANVPADQIDVLVQYLAKNFGPKDASTAASPAPSSGASAQ